MNRAAVSIGSNIDPEENARKAVEILSRNFPGLKFSSFVFTKAIGYTEQPDFLNGAVLIFTDLNLAQLTDNLKKIEAGMGRVRGELKNGPRIIDLDIVVWNGEVVDEDFYKRRFLRDAILELIPDIADRQIQ
ncbi:MAG: 2-amino-4-hydroxy-6-hydroxymethyldihydropteridine diphosphokinase [Fibrobacter sp.]|nr:2-amino-4-hydroxy-6-hydroxymethyldihydropteridine diphosphokinase [Fibrobacter sp.]